MRTAEAVVNVYGAGGLGCRCGTGAHPFGRRRQDRDRVQSTQLGGAQINRRQGQQKHRDASQYGETAQACQTHADYYSMVRPDAGARPRHPTLAIGAITVTDRQHYEHHVAVFGRSPALRTILANISAATGPVQPRLMLVLERHQSWRPQRV